MFFLLNSFQTLSQDTDIPLSQVCKRTVVLNLDLLRALSLVSEALIVGLSKGGHYFEIFF